MPGLMTSKYFKPKDPKEFEEICKAVLKAKTSQKDGLTFKGRKDTYNHELYFTLFGRNGQAQMGIDIYSEELSNKHRYVAQCKNYSDGCNCNKFMKIVDKDLDKMDKLEFEIEGVYIMTTLNRDASIQKEIAKRSKAVNYPINIMFWEDIETIIGENIEIAKSFYSDFFVDKESISDEKAIEIFAEGFERPAFQENILREGSFDYLIKAIEDTVKMLNTGVLMDRDGNILKTGKGIINFQNDEWANDLRIVLKELLSFNKTIQKEVFNGNIQNEGPFYQMSNELANKLNNKKKTIINQFSKVRKKAVGKEMLFQDINY